MRRPCGQSSALMAAAVVLALLAPLPAPARDFAWFWQEAAAPASRAARPARMAGLGEAVLRRHPEIRRLVPLAWATLARHEAALAGGAAAGQVSLPLLLALVVVESGGNARAVSPKGAMGLGQLMPATAARFGVGDAFEPAANLRAAGRYLDWLLRRFGDDAVLALAAYNAGEGAVDARRAVPPFPETRAYVPRVLGLWAALRRACPRLPAHPRHPCPLR